jgi:ParB-like chromosome segregation protein Spo0J
VATEAPPAEPQIRDIAITDINLRDSWQPREAIDQGQVEFYASLPTPFPHVTIFETEEHGNLLADGFHRVTAAITKGDTTIPALVQQGTKRDADIAAAKANFFHGKSLTPTERERNILHVINLGGLSQRAVARLFGITHGQVADISHRASMQTEIGQDITIQETRVLRSAPDEYRRDLAETLGTLPGHNNPTEDTGRGLARAITAAHEAGNTGLARDIAQGRRNAAGELLLNPTVLNRQARQEAQFEPGTVFEFMRAGFARLSRDYPNNEWVTTLVALDSTAGRNNLDRDIHRMKQWLSSVQDTIDAPERTVE